MMNKLKLLAVVGFLLLGFACKQSKNAPGESEKVSGVIDELAVQRIDSTLKSFVDSGNIAGVSALIYENNDEVYYNAFGYADREKKKPMDRNTIVQIFSMTKPITGTALMTLYEDGAFALDDPVSKYAPEFANMKVYELSLIHISEPTRLDARSRMPSSA